MTVARTIFLLTVSRVILGIPVNDKHVKETLPVMDDQVDLRDRRTHNGGPYISPCASSPIPSYAPGIAYQYNMPPAQQYNRPYNPYQYNYPHYRTEHEENEMLTYSDMNHVGSDSVPVGMEMMNTLTMNQGDPRIARIGY